jgi:hypothetical protein
MRIPLSGPPVVEVLEVEHCVLPVRAGLRQLRDL